MKRIALTLRFDVNGVPRRAVLTGVPKSKLAPQFGLHSLPGGFHGVEPGAELHVFTEGAKLYYDHLGHCFIVSGYAQNGADVIDGAWELAAEVRAALA